MGPRAVADLGRHQADRGGARPGVRRLGRQRRERSRQHHHQDAARERGARSRAGRRDLQPGRGVARVRGQRLPVQRQLLVRERDQRHVVVPPERGLLQLRPVLAPRRHRPARLPSPGGRPLPHGVGSGGERGLPDRRRRLSRGRRPAGGLRERRDQPAEVRPAPRPGLRERGPADLRGRLLRHRGDHPHRDRAVPAGERVVHGVRARGLHEGRAARQRLRQLPGRRGAQPARVRPGHPGPDRPGVQDPDLRPRDRQLERAGREAHPDLRRQPEAEQLRHLAGPGRRPHRVRRLRAVGVLRRQVPHRGGRPRRQVRQPRRPGLLAPPQRHVQAHARPLDPRLLQPRVRVAVLHQQLPGPEHPVPQADRPHAAQAPARAGGRPRPAALPADGERLRQPRHEGAVHRRLRGGLHRHLRRKDHGRAVRLPDRHRRQHQLHLRLPAGHPGLSAADLLQRDATRPRASPSRRRRRPRSRSPCRRS